MNLDRRWILGLPILLGLPLAAQPQIGGGTCASSTLSGNYSATLTGRNLTALSYAASTEAIGTVNFDGLSKVTFTLTTNTNGSFGQQQTLSGTYSMQANCVGVMTITSGDNATFSLESYNQGKDYLITGEDGTFGFTGNGSILPATCPASLTAGFYPFNGTGLSLTSASISGIFNILGTIQFSGTNTIAITAVIAQSGSSNKNVSATGTYTLTPNCTATATVMDSSGINYSLVFQFTSASGNNFLLSSASVVGIYTGSGRAL